MILPPLYQRLLEIIDSLFSHFHTNSIVILVYANLESNIDVTCHTTNIKIEALLFQINFTVDKMKKGLLKVAEINRSDRRVRC